MILIIPNPLHSEELLTIDSAADWRAARSDAQSKPGWALPEPRYMGRSISADPISSFGSLDGGAYQTHLTVIED